MGDGTVTTEPQRMAEEINSHWQKVFDEKRIDVDAAEEFLSRFARRFPDIEWFLSEEEFLEVIVRTGNSAPGPDGIPYRAWRNVDGATNYHLNRRDYKSMQRQWAVGTRSNWQRIGIDAAAKAPPPQAVIDVVLADSLRTPSYEQGSEAVKPACVSRGERGGRGGDRRG